MRDCDSWVAAAIAAALVAVSLAGARVSPAGAQNTKCIATGPRFVIHPAHYGPLGGTGSLSCPWIKGALAKIFRANPTLPHRNAPLKAAPAGFSCLGLSLPPPDVAVQGQCTKSGPGGGPGQLFSWAPVDPKRVH